MTATLAQRASSRRVQHPGPRRPAAGSRKPELGHCAQGPARRRPARPSTCVSTGLPEPHGIGSSSFVEA